MKLLRRRAVSPIIATLLLIAIAVASGVIVYVFTSGLASNLTKGNTNQLTEQLSMDAYSFSTLTNPVLYIRNTGTSSVTVAAVYYDGSTSGFSPSPGCTVSVNVDSTTTCSITLGSPATTGTTHQVRVVTTDGGIFSFNVIAGQTG